MFLKSLTIYNDDVIIREIPFHKGINLIVDETIEGNKTEKTESGNSVGKTTVLRLIDFCFDGDGKNIFIDPEFKTNNSKIEDFLKKNNIKITLKLIEDIDDVYSNEIVIERNFLSGRNKILSINGEKCLKKDFAYKLKKEIFKNDKEYPKLRSIISKNIRDEKNKLVNTLKVLNPYTTDVQYESLMMFWLGIDTDLGKEKLIRDKNLEEKLQTRLKKDFNLPQINQSLFVINDKITKLEHKKELFNINEQYEEELSNLNKIKVELNERATNLSRLALRKELILESKSDLEKDAANIDVDNIKELYKRAKVLIPNVQKTFEETLSFHNEMLVKNIQFISEELPQLERNISEEKRSINLLLIQEDKLSRLLKKSGAIEELQGIINELHAYYEKKGSFEEQKRLWEESNKNLNSITETLDTINEKTFSKDDLIQKRIQEFNVYFSDISSRLDGILSILSGAQEDGIYKFKIGNIEGNPGTGSKKSQMASFDLAYIKFADALNIPCLHFVLQDQIENVHSNQITNLLTEIVDEVNCQYVLPVLSDKLPKDIDISQFQVLSLSQSNKLFRI